jgi:hypothetical protein
MSEARAKAELQGVYQAWKVQKVETSELLDAVAKYLEPASAEPASAEASAPRETCGELPPAYALEGALKGCAGCSLPAGHTGRSHSDTTEQHGWVLWTADEECGCCAAGDPDHCISFLHDGNPVAAR